MSLLKGSETTQEIIILAYGMEAGLGEFYSAIAEGMDDQEVVHILTHLAAMEEKHKQNLFDLYLSYDPDIVDRERFETNIASKVMEGGFTTQEFLEKNRDSTKTVPDVLNIAMMLETQALDLYMRYAEKVKVEQNKSVFYDIAEQEKAHLRSLGNLMEEKV